MVGFVILGLCSCASYLIAIRDEKYEKRADNMIVRDQNLSSINYRSYTNKSLIDHPLYFY